jgi:hypothetical protein
LARVRVRYKALAAPETTMEENCGFPSRQNTIGAAIRLVGVVLLEQNNAWRLQHRYMRIEGFAELNQPMIERDHRPLHIAARAA